MAIQTSPIRTEIETSVKETIHSLLQRYPEHDGGSVLNEVLRHSFQTITKKFGKTFPKELRWCEKLPTIVLLEESISAENQLMAEPTTQNDTITTQDKPIAERCLVPDDTTQDSASATEDTSNHESLPQSDTTAQDGASATQDASSSESHSTTNNTSSTAERLFIEDSIVQELMEQAENFKKWTNDPSLFWNHIAPLVLPESTPSERNTVFCEYAAEECTDAMVQTAARRFNSIIVYLSFKKCFPSAQRTTETIVQRFIKHLNLKVTKERVKKYKNLLSMGRRRLEFCHNLSKVNTEFHIFNRDVKFEDIEYGFLYLSLDERLWNKDTRYRELFKQTLAELDNQKILDTVETSGANLAAKTALQSRMAFINNDSTSNQSSTEAAKLGVQESRALFDKDNITEASKRSSTEAGLDGPGASKRFCAGFDVLLHAATCQNATASNTAISNDSNLQIVQSNEAPSPNNAPPDNVSSPNNTSSLNNTASPNIEVDQNLADTQEGNLGDMNATSEEPQQQEVADLCTSDWDAEQQAILDTYNWDAEQQAILDTYNWDKFGGYGFSPMFQDLVPETDPSLPNVGSLSIDRTDTL
ncbi:hypothetical protein Trisim1_002746 [Trichoderma cf. simile WF8]